MITWSHDHMTSRSTGAVNATHTHTHSTFIHMYMPWQPTHVLQWQIGSTYPYTAIVQPMQDKAPHLTRLPLIIVVVAQSEYVHACITHAHPVYLRVCCLPMAMRHKSTSLLYWLPGPHRLTDVSVLWNYVLEVFFEGHNSKLQCTIFSQDIVYNYHGPNHEALATVLRENKDAHSFPRKLSVRLRT